MFLYCCCYCCCASVLQNSSTDQVWPRSGLTKARWQEIQCGDYKPFLIVTICPATMDGRWIKFRYWSGNRIHLRKAPAGESDWQYANYFRLNKFSKWTVTPLLGSVDDLFVLYIGCCCCCHWLNVRPGAKWVYIVFNYKSRLISTKQLWALCSFPVPWNGRRSHVCNWMRQVTVSHTRTSSHCGSMLRRLRALGIFV